MWLNELFVLIIGYLICSFPTAFVAGKLIKGIDIRNYGSGNVGATNALRVLGKKWGIFVLVVDMLKGFFSIVFLPKMFNVECSPLFLTFLGISSVVGHIWSLFLKFKGGKGVATTLGVIIGLGVYKFEMFLVILATVGVWILVFIIWKIVSLASLISSIFLPVFTFYICRDFFILTLILFLIIFYRHLSNIKRLFKREEKPLFN